MDSGLARARGLASSTKWTAAELLDTAARRGVDGGRGNDERRRRQHSVALRKRAEEGEGVLGERGEVQGVEGSAWRPRVPPAASR